MGIALCGCGGKEPVAYEKGSFGYDLNFLSGKDSVMVLADNDSASLVLVSPKYQGKVFTSSLEGLGGKSIGWVNHKAFELATPDEHMNGFGGENRFWLGPEGGVFSLFFKEGVAQEIANWYTPKGIDIEAWELVRHSATTVGMKKDMNVSNYKGTDFAIAIERDIELINKAEISKLLGNAFCDDLKFVAYKSVNRITNKNDFAWTDSTGTVCMWMLDMFPHGENASTLVPFNEGSEAELGKRITSDYFGEIPADRLYEKNGVFVFKTDGKFRSKIGLNSKRTKGIAANFNNDTMILTVITFGFEKDATYLNQEWNIERNPLVGDVFNAYNDGPLADGSQMGPFLELESSSPAAFLKPGESMEHIHNVYHFSGSIDALNKISNALLGISLTEL